MNHEIITTERELERRRRDFRKTEALFWIAAALAWTALIAGWLR